MPYNPPIWGFEPQSTRRAREVSKLREVQDEVSPLVAAGDSMSLLQAQQIAKGAIEDPAQSLIRQRVRNQRIGLEAKQGITAATEQTDNSLIGKVGAAWKSAIPEGVRNALGEGFNIATSAERALDVALPGEPGTAAGELIGKTPWIGGAARTAFDAGLSPASLASAGLGSAVAAPALAGLRGAGIGGRIAAGALGPVVGGGFKANIAAQAAAAIGGKYGSELGSKGAEALGGGETAQTIGGIAGGLAGGVAGIGGLQGAKALNRGLQGQSAREAMAAAAPEAAQFGRGGATQDLIDPDFARGGRAFPVPRLEDEGNIAVVDSYLRPRIGDDGVRSMREWERRKLAGDLFEAERLTQKGPRPPIEGANPTIGGGADLTPENLQALIDSKKAAGMSAADIFADPDVQAYQRRLFKLDEPKDFNAPENLGGGVPITPEQQANMQGTVKRAAQSNTIRDSLANARSVSRETLDSANTAAPLTRAEQMAQAREEFARGQANPITDQDRMLARAGGFGSVDEMRAAQSPAGQARRLEMVRSQIDDLQGEMANRDRLLAMDDATLARNAPSDLPPTMDYRHALEVAQREAQNELRSLSLDESRYAQAQPNALDKVISRNVDDLPEPTRTQPPAGYLDKFRKPSIGGGAPDLPGSERPFLKRPNDPRIPTSSNTPSQPELMAEPQNVTPESYPYETFPGPKFGSVEADYQQGARVTLPGERPVSDYGRQGSLMDVAPTEERGSAWQNFKDLLSAPRALMTMGDVGGTTRQTGMLAPSHPRAWAQSVVDQFKAYRSPEAAQAVYDRINAHPLRPYLNKMGIEITDATGDIAKQEEAFQHGNSMIARAVQKVPLLERSGRAYTTGTTSMRAGAAYDWLSSKSPEQLAALSDDTLKAMGGFFNAATGRGNLPEFLKDHAQTLNAAFFAPRNFIGKVQANAAVFSRNSEVRKEAAKSLASFYLTGSAIIGLAALGGAKVGTDPRGSDFGKIQLPGGTRIDIWGGNQQIMRLAANLATGQQASTRTGDVYDQSRIDTVSRFLKSKLAPVPSTLLAASQGATTDNEQLKTDPGSLGSQAIKLVTPLFLQDFHDALVNSGPGEALAVGALAGIGVGTQTYQKGPADDLAKQYYGKPYASLSGPERGDLNRAHPELAGQLLDEQAKAAGTTGQAAQFRQNTRMQQQASDDQLLSGQITRQQWQQQRGDRAMKQRGALEAIYGHGDAISEEQAARDPLKRYLKAIAENTDPATGVVDAGALAAARESWGPEVNELVDKSLGTNDTPLERLYRQAAGQYYDLPRYRGYSADEAKQIDGLWTKARAQARSSSDLDMARALRAVAADSDLSPRIVSGARKRIAGTLTQDTKRKALANRDPLAGFFFGSKALTAAQKSQLQSRLGTGEAA